MDVSLQKIRPNLVQSIRAFSVNDLQTAAMHTGQHFLYANLADAQSKQEALDMLVEQFTFPAHVAKSFESLREAMTDAMYKCGGQLGFIVMLEHLPSNQKFDKETREQLLDLFRDAAEYWAERKVPFRCFYSFSVARAIPEDQRPDGDVLTDALSNELMPTNKVADVSPLALRMSSPFNASYWLTAA